MRQYGPNSLVQESRFATLFSILRPFANPLVFVLLVASGISLGLGDHIGGWFIIAIVLLSILLNFLMGFQARHAVEEIQKQLATTAAVLRDGREREVPVAELVPGDLDRLITERGRFLDPSRALDAVADFAHIVVPNPLCEIRLTSAEITQNLTCFIEPNTGLRLLTLSAAAE